MISFRGSSATTPAQNFDRRPLHDGDDNIAWLSEQVADLDARDPGRRFTYIVLLGGTGTYDFRLRTAQSHLRSDLSPSHWSHACLIYSQSRRITNRTEVLEAALEPWEGFRIPAKYNGLQNAPVRRYADPERFPNIALIQVPVSPSRWREKHSDQQTHHEVKSVLDQFADQRAVLDVSTLLLQWLAFVWCSGDAGNPLLDNHGIPAAAVVEALIGACGYDLTPGLDTSASSPEALWQAAKWWQDFLPEDRQLWTRFRTQGREVVYSDDDPGIGTTTKSSGSTAQKRAAQKTTASQRTASVSEAFRTGAMPMPQDREQYSPTAHMFNRS